MNKILSNAIFYGSAIVIGGSIGTAIAFSQSNTSKEIDTVIEEVAQIEENVQENDIKEPIPAEIEEKPAKKEEKSVEKPAKKSPTTTQVTPQVTTQVETKNESTNEETWVYYMDEEKYLGLCPSQLPADARNKSTAPLNAIGIVSSGPNAKSQINSLNSLVENWWSDYKLGKWTGRHMMASLNNVAGFDKTYANSRIAFFIEFDYLFVVWDNSWEDGKTINATTEQMMYLDDLVSDATYYLRWLDSTYNAKCPND